jgi:hypothetical protein
VDVGRPPGVAPEPLEEAADGPVLLDLVGRRDDGPQLVAAVGVGVEPSPLAGLGPRDLHVVAAFGEGVEAARGGDIGGQGHGERRVVDHRPGQHPHVPARLLAALPGDPVDGGDLRAGMGEGPRAGSLGGRRMVGACGSLSPPNGEPA